MSSGAVDGDPLLAVEPMLDSVVGPNSVVAVDRAPWSVEPQALARAASVTTAARAMAAVVTKGDGAEVVWDIETLLQACGPVVRWEGGGSQERRSTGDCRAGWR